MSDSEQNKSNQNQDVLTPFGVNLEEAKEENKVQRKSPPCGSRVRTCDECLAFPCEEFY